jgi:hypothetical protein
MTIKLHPASLVSGSLIAVFFFVIGGWQQVTITPHRLHTLTPEQAEILGHMSIEYLDDSQGGTVKTIRVGAVNWQIVNGTGSTDGAANGLGNLIVGYNETGNVNGDDRTGSHNIVGGQSSSFRSHGGLVVGRSNTVSAAWSAVSGGRNNTASGTQASVSGGGFNTASAVSSSVSGGNSNIASGYWSSISGGFYNTATASYSSVSGGRSNTASAAQSSVSGGHNRSAVGPYNWAAGTLAESD